MSALLSWLRSQKENRGVMAQLRCALAPTREQRAWPLLARFGGIGLEHKHQVVRTIAGLYASHPLEGNTAMGTLCLRLCSDSENPWKDEAPGAVAKRVQHLLAAESHELCDRVVRLILRAKTQGIAVDYEQLERDLLDWDSPSRRDRVRVEWAKQFWAPGGNAAKNAAEEENT